jgi:2-(1,2-epoxy-1,2-dihydrophenyl)acetyl-CoA isomerase
MAQCFASVTATRHAGVVAYDRLMDDALAVAQRLAQGPASLALTRKLFWDSDYDAQLQREQTAQHFREGLAAFPQKRPPHFTGK